MGSPVGNVQFAQTNLDAGEKRFWYFGDGGKDSTVKNISHQYTQQWYFLSIADS
jgi:PKD repeat protein